MMSDVRFERWRALWRTEYDPEIFEERRRLLARICWAGVVGTLMLMILSALTLSMSSHELFVAEITGAISVTGFGIGVAFARGGHLNSAAFASGFILCVAVCAGEVALQGYSDRLWYTIGGIALVGFALNAERLVWVALACTLIDRLERPVHPAGVRARAGPVSHDRDRRDDLFDRRDAAALRQRAGDRARRGARLTALDRARP